jgi:acetolactate synthase-1/2/3 large subunit
MKVSDYVVDFLVNKGVTDVFGMPGGVVLDFLYAVDRRREKITAHLNYHEQAAAFAACGYAQVFGKLGVAYSTKGPGVTNMITGIADTYRDSIPVLFITAHAHVTSLDNIRFEENQEFDTKQMLSKTTKYASRVERLQDVRYALERACHLAVSGRPGPVFLDFRAGLWNEEITSDLLKSYEGESDDFIDGNDIINTIKSEMEKASRPVLLIGDGIRQSGTQSYIEKIADKLQMPILSSRCSQDIMPDSRYYYGYIGSHATRYSNFVLSKCDLAISLGNRLAYSPDSQSFGRFARQVKIIRIDIDANEFERELPNTINFHVDLREIMPALAKFDFDKAQNAEWLKVCDTLRSELWRCDTEYPIEGISQIIKNSGSETVITSDVGNNEFWLSRAYALAGKSNRVLYSKSFGALGCSLPKAIGAHYATGKTVLCFAGDQGFQMNIQELQLIAHEGLPVKIIVLNNASSGMIRDGQRRKYGPHYIHTTRDSGYSIPNFKEVAHAFSIPFSYFTESGAVEKLLASSKPCIIEMAIDEGTEVLPFLPKENPCQDFEPRLEKYHYLDTL